MQPLLSINFVVRAMAFEQNCLFALVPYKLENHAHVVTGAARPRTGRLALELVGLELRMKSVLRQQVQNRLQFRRHLRMPPRKPAARPDERRGRQQQPFQAKRCLMICAGVAGRQRPAWIRPSLVADRRGDLLVACRHASALVAAVGAVRFWS